MEIDWRSPEAYSGITNLMPREIAWEFLRRNPDYLTDFDKSRKLKGDASDQFARRWGLRFGVDPEIPAKDAPLFWLYAECASVVILSPAATTPAASTFSLSDLHGFFKWRRAEDGAHILLRENGYNFQLFAATNAKNEEDLHLSIPMNEGAQLRCEVTSRFCRFFNGEKPLLIRRHVGVNQRLRDALRVLDGNMAGASYREITEVLRGSHRINDEVWKTSSARAVTIRLMQQAKSLMSGGYETLLNS